MAPLTRSAVKQRVVRVRSSVEIDMPRSAGGGSGAADDRTSLHWSDDDGGSGDEAASAPLRKGARDGAPGGAHGAPGIAPYEWGNMALLVLLYAMQGIPLGLTMGTM
jgi:hypothetical protein